VQFSFTLHLGSTSALWGPDKLTLCWEAESDAQLWHARLAATLAELPVLSSKGRREAMLEEATPDERVVLSTAGPSLVASEDAYGELRS
jgi:hypothetical protein